MQMLPVQNLIFKLNASTNAHLSSVEVFPRSGTWKVQSWTKTDKSKILHDGLKDSALGHSGNFIEIKFEADYNVNGDYCGGIG